MERQLPNQEEVLAPSQHEGFTVQFYTTINKASMTPIRDALLEQAEADPTRQIIIRVNSLGGQLQASIDLAKALHQIPNPVTTIAESQVMSGALLLVALGDPGRRFAHEDSEFMLHRMQISWKKKQMSAPESLRFFKNMLRTERAYFRELALATGRPVSELMRLAENDNYMTAQQAKDLGLIDHIIPRVR